MHSKIKKLSALVFTKSKSNKKEAMKPTSRITFFWQIVSRLLRLLYYDSYRTHTCFNMKLQNPKSTTYKIFHFALRSGTSLLYNYEEKLLSDSFCDNVDKSLLYHSRLERPYSQLAGRIHINSSYTSYNEY